jgi:hypothetical protein
MSKVVKKSTYILSLVLERIFLLLIVITIGLIAFNSNHYSISHDDQLSYKTTASKICIERSLCFSDQDSIAVINRTNIDNLSRQKSDQNKLKIAQIAKLPKIICIVNPASVNTSYNKLLLSALANTNEAVDSVRSAAVVNGESYKVFDAQADTLFSIYNQKVSDDYTTYQKSMSGCSGLEPAPTLFAMFAP